MVGVGVGGGCGWWVWVVGVGVGGGCGWWGGIGGCTRGRGGVGLLIGCWGLGVVGGAGAGVFSTKKSTLGTPRLGLLFWAVPKG